MSLAAFIMIGEGGTATVEMMEARQMSDHNGAAMMQRVLLAGTIGLAMARRAAAILEGQPGSEPQGGDGVVLRAILDAASECLGQFDDRPAAERWCDTVFHLLDLAAFAGEMAGPAALG
jgi:hypothetical protein